MMAVQYTQDTIDDDGLDFIDRLLMDSLIPTSLDDDNDDNTNNNTTQFLSKDDSSESSSPSPSVSMFQSKDAFSFGLFASEDWDFKKQLQDQETRPIASTVTTTKDSAAAAAPTPSAAPPIVTVVDSKDFNPSASQDYIPKLLETKDWDANLRMEDVLATATSLLPKTLLLPSHPPAADTPPIPMEVRPPPPASVTAPTSAFSDAFKSKDWSIPSGALAENIHYSPNMLLPTATTEPPFSTKITTGSAPFKSLDWVMTEILGDCTNKDAAGCLAPKPDGMPSCSLPSSAFDLSGSTAAPKKTATTTTDWDAMFLQELPLLLSSSAVPSPSGVVAPSPGADTIAPGLTTTKTTVDEAPIKKKRIRKKRKKVVPNHKVYVTNISEVDVLLGRGGRSNHHPGNKRYREEVENYRTIYDTLHTSDEKTQISQALVDAINIAGGRFLEKEDRIADKLGQWYVVPNIVARRKASQALREDNDPMKRKAKRARYLEKKKQLTQL